MPESVEELAEFGRSRRALCRDIGCKWDNLSASHTIESGFRFMPAEIKSEAFDALDWKILEILQSDATLSLTEVARRAGSSKSVCWRRIQGYLSKGVISSRVALLDPKKVGLGVLIFAFVKIDGRGRATLDDFLKALQRLPEVVECHALMGDVDLMLKIVVPTIEYYDEFLWRKLAGLPAVADIKSTISLSRFINTTRLPLPIRTKVEEP